MYYTTFNEAIMYNDCIPTLVCQGAILKLTDCTAEYNEDSEENVECKGKVFSLYETAIIAQ